MSQAIVAFGLTIFDFVWCYDHFIALNADITIVGVDSLIMNLPIDRIAAKFENGKWDFGPTQLFPINIGFDLHQEKIAFVSLAPQENLGHAVEVIRDLKSRGACNVLIRENGQIQDDFESPTKNLAIQGYVLCGNPIGDAGFSGPLPSDHRIHVHSLNSISIGD